MMRGPIYALVLLVPAQLAFGQSDEKPPPAKWNVRIDVQMLAVPKEDAPALIRRLQNPRQTEAAADELQKMLGTGRAELIGWPVTWAADRSRASAETLQEVRFVTEPDFRLRFSPSTFHSGVPEMHDTRNAGVTLEVEPVVQEDGLSVEVNFVPQSVKLTGFRAQRLDRTRGGLETFVEHPQFDVQKLTTSLTVRSGARQLIGVFYGQEANAKVTLFVLRAVILPLDAAFSSK